MLSAALAAFLSLCLFFAGGAQAWLATSYYQQSYQTETYEGGYSTYTTTYTDQIPVKPTVTSFAPLSVETSVNSNYDVTYVNILVPSGVAATTQDDTYYDDYSSSARTTYYVELFLTANPSFCSSDDWVWKTKTTVDVPYGVTPAAASTTTSWAQRAAFGPTTTYTHAFLNPTDIPASSLSSMKSRISSAVYWASYSCTVPIQYRSGLVSERGMTVAATGTDATGIAAAATASPTSDSDYAAICAAKLARNGGSLSNYGYGYYDEPFGMGHWEYCDTNDDCACFHGLQWWAIIPIIICSWIGFFLIAGMIESWFRFRNLARGRSARRGLPIAWTLIMIPWTCFFLCCSKRGYTKKSPEEQKILTEEWKKMGFWNKIGRWLKWGFRYKYPTFLGPVPFRRTRWEEKDIAVDAQRRLSVSAAPMAQSTPMGVPIAAHQNSYYAPQPPQAAYATPGVAASDFAQQQDRGMGRNTQSDLHSVSEGQGGDGPLPVLPPRPQDSPVSPINTAQESIAGPAPRSQEVMREAFRGDPAAGRDAPQVPPIAVTR